MLGFGASKTAQGAQTLLQAMQPLHAHSNWGHCGKSDAFSLSLNINGKQVLLCRCVIDVLAKVTVPATKHTMVKRESIL